MSIEPRVFACMVVTLAWFLVLRRVDPVITDFIADRYEPLFEQRRYLLSIQVALSGVLTWHVLSVIPPLAAVAILLPFS